MSALRLGRNPDGTRDIRVIDDGVESVRMHPSRLGIRGGIGNPIVGAFVQGASREYDPRDRTAEKVRRRERRAEVAAKQAKTCAAPMPYGDVCARVRGHKWDHRTRYCMDNAARQRRAGFVA